MHLPDRFEKSSWEAVHREAPWILRSVYSSWNGAFRPCAAVFGVLGGFRELPWAVLDF